MNIALESIRCRPLPSPSIIGAHALNGDRADLIAIVSRHADPIASTGSTVVAEITELRMKIQPMARERIRTSPDDSPRPVLTVEQIGSTVESGATAVR